MVRIMALFFFLLLVLPFHSESRRIQLNLSYMDSSLIYILQNQPKLLSQIVNYFLDIPTSINSVMEFCQLWNFIHTFPFFNFQILFVPSFFYLLMIFLNKKKHLYFTSFSPLPFLKHKLQLLGQTPHLLFKILFCFHSDLVKHETLEVGHFIDPSYLTFVFISVLSQPVME